MIMIKKTGVKLALLLVSLLVISAVMFTGVADKSFAAEKHYVKVGLYYGNTSKDRYEISFKDGVTIANIDGYNINYLSDYREARKLVVSKNNGNAECTLVDDSGYEVKHFDIRDYNAVLPIDFERDGIFTIDGKNYRGGVLVTDMNGTLNLIDFVDEEKYLYGVVGSEIGKSTPIEAQKAQAVAARSFIRIKMGTHASYGFDVCSTAHCQVYKGYDDEASRVNQAVDETAGETVKYNGETVGAFYSKNSGGYTAASEDVWGGKLGYLKAVKDEYSPDFPWKKSFTKNEIEEKLNSAGKSIGSLQEIRIDERASSGLVTKLTFVGSIGSVSYTKDNIRLFLGASNVKSLMFTFDGNLHNIKPVSSVNIDRGSNADVINPGTEPLIHGVAPVYILSKDGQNVSSAYNAYCISGSKGGNQTSNISLLGATVITKNGMYTLQTNSATSIPAQTTNTSTQSSSSTPIGSTANNFVAQRIGGYESVRVGNDVLFTGLGYGHGVGLAQDGAIEMGNRGFTYKDILRYYYKDITIE